jgi:tetratricopeptide (TPR) repeat protein
MAHFRLGFVNLLGEFDDADRVMAMSHIYRAGELNRGLSEHDSLIIEAVARRTAVWMDLVPDSLRRSELEAGRAEALEAATQFPEDAEAWFVAGVVGSTDPPLDAYVRAIELDSAFGPAYKPAISGALKVGDYDLAQRLAAQYLALDPPGRSVGLAELLAKALDPAVPEAEVESVLDSLSNDNLGRAFMGLMELVDSGEVVIRIAREASSRAHDQRFMLTADFVEWRNLAAMLAYRGHIREAYELTGTEDESWFMTLFAELAVWGHVPEEVADSTFQAWLTADPYYPYFGIATAHWWLASRGDTAGIQTIIRNNPDVARDLSPYLALARRDTAEALLLFAERREADAFCCFWDPLAFASLLVARGRDSEALEVLKGPDTTPWPVPTRGYWALERARLADRLGDRETAIDSYQFVADLWRNADEELQVYVDEARDALRRLTVEPEGA